MQHNASLRASFDLPVRLFQGQEDRRLESTQAFPTVLIAEYAKPSLSIPAQSVRAKQSKPPLIHRLDRLFVLHGSPDQPINLLHRLDLCLDDPHLNSVHHVDRVNFNGTYIL